MNAPPAQPGNRILIIDDNASIHADFRKILGQEQDQNVGLDLVKARLLGESTAASPRSGFVIDSAFQGQEGLAMAKQAAEEGNPYALAFVDVRMPPGWDGVETIGHLWKCCPELQIVVCTAYSDYSWEEMIRQLGHSPNLVVLQKPFDNIEALQLAHALTEKWHLNRKVQSQLDDLDTLVRRRTSELETANAQPEEGNRRAQQVRKCGAGDIEIMTGSGGGLFGPVASRGRARRGCENGITGRKIATRLAKFFPQICQCPPGGNGGVGRFVSVIAGELVVWVAAASAAFLAASASILACAAAASSAASSLARFSR